MATHSQAACFGFVSQLSIDLADYSELPGYNLIESNFF